MLEPKSLNAEQTVAAKHSGGMLLTAGAGSGKTFVIVEHLVYLCEEFLPELKKVDALLWPEKVKEFLGAIVVMTFTNKAVDELKVRIHARFQLAVSLHTQSGWPVLMDQFEALNILTIHGLCFKLISQGLISRFGTDLKILGNIQNRAKLKELYADWYLSRKESKALGVAGQEIILSNEKRILEGFEAILGDAEHRFKWSKGEKLVSKKSEGEFLAELFRLQRWNKLYPWNLNLASISEWKDKGWYTTLAHLSTVLNKKEGNLISELYAFIDSYPRLPPGPKAGDPLLIEAAAAHGQLKAMKEYLKEERESLVPFFEGEKAPQEWMQILTDLFNFLEQNYLKREGLTFSDLEYYVSKELENPEILQRIVDRYRYFIVDEFQDISPVQFTLLEQLVQGDYQKVFLVGDHKQSIYGFRGGDVEIFRRCEKIMPKTCELRNNFRSAPAVVHFNNALFADLMSRTNGFEASDPQVFSEQIPAGPFEDAGNVYSVQALLEKTFEPTEERNSFSADRVNYLEALGIRDHIEFLLGGNEEAEVCVLYKNLSPSLFLIKLLIDSGRGHISQIKVPILEAPILGMLQDLLESYLDKNFQRGELAQGLRYLTLKIETYFKFLGMEPPENLEGRLTEFFANLLPLGLMHAYFKLIHDLNISHAQVGHELEILRALTEEYGNHYELLWSALSELRDEKFSLEFQFGEDKRVTLMSTHGAKGLEFEQVVLAGIHTNGRGRQESNLLGKNPGSFKWKLLHSQRNYLWTPSYLLEKLEQEEKDFAESVRLLYVACTRAEKGLSWIDLEIDYRAPRNSWIHGLHAFLKETPAEKLPSITQRKISLIETPGNVGLRQLPLFHSYPMSMLGKVNQEHQTLVAITPELSVTRLATLGECPRKFYLESVCKIDETELGILHEVLGISENLYKDFKDKNLEPTIKSSKARGIQWHRKMSEAIAENFEGRSSKILGSWAFEQIKPLTEKFELISEHALKFSLFNFLLSGTPDLVLKPKDEKQKWEIWDYKTGAMGEVPTPRYWFQLQCYAHAIKQIYGVTQKEIDLVLMYPDEERSERRTFQYSDIETMLVEYWQKLGRLDQVNLQHCSVCSFNNICKPTGMLES